MTKTFGILGHGSIGKRHAQNLVRLGHKVLTFDPSNPIPKSAPPFIAMHDEQDLINNADAILICSPTALHYEHLVKGLFARKPIFVEKPIGDTEKCHFLGSVMGRDPFMVGYNLRFHSCVKKAKEWLDNGILGQIQWASFVVGQKNDKLDYLRDGVILNWSHEIDLALYLLGPAKVLQASARVTGSGEDIADIWLQHDSGARSSIHLDYVTKPEIREAWIVGANNRIGMDLVGRNASLGEYVHRGDDSFDQNYVEEIRAFIDRIDGKETIGCNAKEGLAALEICLQARRLAGLSSETFAHSIPWTPPSESTPTPKSNS
jgi:predicted dehydrogenase